MLNAHFYKEASSKVQYIDFRVAVLSDELKVLTAAIERFISSLEERVGPDPEIVTAYAEPCVGIERMLRALVSICALLILVGEPGSLRGGFKAA